MENNKLSPEEMRSYLNNLTETLMKKTGQDKMTVLKNMKTLLKKRNNREEKE